MLFLEAGRLSEAVPLLRMDWKRRDVLYGPTSIEVVEARASLAQAEALLGHHDKAAAQYEAATAVSDLLIGERDPRSAQLRQALGEAYVALELPDEGLPLLESAHGIFEAQYGVKDMRTASALNSLAGALIKLNRVVEAAPLCNRALIARHASLGAGHPDTIASLNNCALCYEYQGQMLDALPLHVQAVAIVRDSVRASVRASCGSDTSRSSGGSSEGALLGTVLANYGALLCGMLEPGSAEEEARAAVSTGDDPRLIYLESFWERASCRGIDDRLTNGALIGVARGAVGGGGHHPPQPGTALRSYMIGMLGLAADYVRSRPSPGRSLSERQGPIVLGATVSVGGLSTHKKRRREEEGWVMGIATLHAAAVSLLSSPALADTCFREGDDEGWMGMPGQGGESLLGGLAGVCGRPTAPWEAWEAFIADGVARLAGGKGRVEAFTGALRQGGESAHLLYQALQALLRETPPRPAAGPRGGTEDSSSTPGAVSSHGLDVEALALSHVSTLYEAVHRELDAAALLERVAKMRATARGIHHPDTRGAERALSRLRQGAAAGDNSSGGEGEWEYIFRYGEE